MKGKTYNDGRLSEAFYNAVANSRDSRIENLSGMELDVSEIMDRSKRLARAILNGANDLVSDSSVARAQEEIESMFSDKATTENNEVLATHVGQVIDEQMGYSIVSMQASAESRFIKLVLLGQKVLIDKQTSEYLRHVTFCYLIGLDEQCIIMCRSALEAAFLQAIPDFMCEEVPEVRKKPLPNKEKPEYSLNDRIKTASAKNITTEYILKLARFVKNIANDLIHPNRKMQRELDEKVMDMIVKETVEVISALSDR